MTNELRSNYEYKLAFESGLLLVGFDEGRPEWLGNNVDWANYHEAIKRYEQFN